MALRFSRREGSTAVGANRQARRVGAAAALIGAALLAGGARADPPASASLSPSAEPAAAAPMAKPLLVGVTYYGDALATVSGGIAPGWAYEGRLGLLLDVDLSQTIGWKGARLHASLHQIHGQAPTPAHVGALALLSGIEAEPNTRLFNLWVEQQLGEKATLRLGQFTAAQEFAVSPTAGLFVNSTFGWPNLLAQDLPSGGPAYPIGALGARFSYAGPKASLLAAIFNGDPAGPGGGDPQRRDRFGLNSFHLSGGPFLIGEAQLAPPRTSAKLRVGAWWLDREVPSQPLGPASAPGAAQPRNRQGDWGAYAIIDSMIAKRGDASLAGFVRLGAAPGDRNLVDAYVDAGLTLSGFVPRRPDDHLGLALAWSRIGSAAREADAAAIAVGALAVARDHEGVVEATYQAQLTPHWQLQPDLQWVVHPGGHVPLPPPGRAARPIPDAVVVGLRNLVRF
jgi:porin